MASVLGKKYTNPSSDIIELLAGLDHIDTVFADFVAALESLIRAGRSSGFECCPNGIGHAGHLHDRPAAEGCRGGLSSRIGGVPDQPAVVFYAEGLVPGHHQR
jgi:hypothetical protein